MVTAPLAFYGGFDPPPRACPLAISCCSSPCAASSWPATGRSGSSAVRPASSAIRVGGPPSVRSTRATWSRGGSSASGRRSSATGVLGRQRGDHRQQPRVDRRAVGDRLAARRREALQREPDAREGVGRRAPEAGGISYTEFSYQVMQALDFLELYRRHGVLQLGGSDQWGNLTAGVDLIRRAEGATAHALATPLIEARRREVREEHGVDAVAGPVAHEPVRLLPVVPERRRRRRGHLSARLQLPLAREIEALESEVPLGPKRACSVHSRAR